MSKNKYHSRRRIYAASSKSRNRNWARKFNELAESRRQKSNRTRQKNKIKEFEFIQFQNIQPVIKSSHLITAWFSSMFYDGLKNIFDPQRVRVGLVQSNATLTLVNFDDDGKQQDKFVRHDLRRADIEKLNQDSSFMKVLVDKKSENPKEQIKNSSVLMRMETFPMQFTIDILRSFFYSNTAEALEEIQAQVKSFVDDDAEKLSKFLVKLFPAQTNIKFPLFNKLKLEIGEGGRRIIRPIVKVPLVANIKYSDFTGKPNSYIDRVIKDVAAGLDIDESILPAEVYMNLLQFRLVIDEESFEVPLMSGMLNQVVGSENTDLDENQVVNRNKLEKGEMTLPELMAITNNKNQRIVFSPKLEIFIRYPMEYALWATCTESIKEFNAGRFADIHNAKISTQAVGYVSGNKSGLRTSGVRSAPTRVSSMPLVKKDAEEMQQHFNKRFQPRVNEDNFAVTRNAQPLYIPLIDNTDEYEKLIGQRLTPENQILTPSQVGLSNRLIYTDWLNNKFSYTAKDGELTIQDLNGCSAMTAQYVFRALQVNPTHDGDYNYAGNFMMEVADVIDEAAGAGYEGVSSRIIDKAVKQATDIFQQRYGDKFTVPNIISGYNFYNLWYTVGNVFNTRGANPCVGGLFGPLDPESFEFETGRYLPDGSQTKNDSEVPVDKYMQHYFMLEIMRQAVPMLRDKLKALVDSNSLPNKLSLDEVLTRHIFGIYLLSNYAPKLKEITTIYLDNLQRNRNRIDPDDHEFSVPGNLSGLESLLPHQARIIAGLSENKPNKSIIDVSAGGGKTIISIYDALKLIEEKRVKRTLVITKENLIGQFKSEIMYFGKGEINCFTLSKAVIQDLLKNFKDEVDAESLVQFSREKYPANSIFLTSFSFIKKSDWSNTPLFASESIIRSKKDGLVYGNYIGAKKSMRNSATGTNTSYYSSMPTFPMVDLINFIGFDGVFIDEAHYTKNETSQVSQAAYRIVSNAKVVRWMSGTIVTNTPDDLAGVISPAGVLPSKDVFKDLFMNGMRLKENMAPVIDNIVTASIARFTARRKEWSYMLSNIEEHIIPAPMTAVQEVFYKKLLEQQEEKFSHIIKDHNKKNSIPGTDIGEEDEETMSNLEFQLQASMTRLEVFMGAPNEDAVRRDGDENSNDDIPTFRNFEIKPGLTVDRLDKNLDYENKHLVSPKVKILNKLLGAHFFGEEFNSGNFQIGKFKGDPNSNKVLITSYNKPLSRHIFEHLDPRFKKMALRFVASPTKEDEGLDLLDGQEALDKFRNDPKYRILVADVASITEGLNLQMCSVLIEMQTLFSPGKMEQARARVARPDPKGKYKRDKLLVLTVAAVPNNPDTTSIDYVKFARMVTKIISKAQLDYVDDPAWRSQMQNNQNIVLPEKQGLKLSPQAIFGMKMDDIIPYLDVYKHFARWEMGQFHEMRVKMRRKIAQNPKLRPQLIQNVSDTSGTRPEDVTDQQIQASITDAQLFALSKYPVKFSKKIEGSKRAFSPYLQGETIYDEFGLDLGSVIAYNSELATSEDEDYEGEVLKEVEIGDPIMTSFGPGRVLTIGSKYSCKVEIPGLGKITADKRTSYVAMTEKGRQRFERLLNIIGDNGLPTLSKNLDNISYSDDHIKKILETLDSDKEIPKPNKGKRKPEPIEDEIEDDEFEDEIEDDEFEDDKEVFQDSGDGIDGIGEEEIVMDAAIDVGILNDHGILIYIGNPDDPKYRSFFLSKHRTKWTTVPDFFQIRINDLKSYKAWMHVLKNEYPNIDESTIDFMNKVANKAQSGQEMFLNNTKKIAGMESFFRKAHQPVKRGSDKIKPWIFVYNGQVRIGLDVAAHRNVLTLDKLRKLSLKVRKLHGKASKPELVNHYAITYIGSKAEAKRIIKFIHQEEQFNVLYIDEVLQDLKGMPPIPRSSSATSKNKPKTTRKPINKTNTEKEKPKTTRKRKTTKPKSERTPRPKKATPTRKTTRK